MKDKRESDIGYLCMIVKLMVQLISKYVLHGQSPGTQLTQISWFDVACEMMFSLDFVYATTTLQLLELLSSISKRYG